PPLRRFVNHQTSDSCESSIVLVLDPVAGRAICNSQFAIFNLQWAHAIYLTLPAWTPRQPPLHSLLPPKQRSSSAASPAPSLSGQSCYWHSFPAIASSRTTSSCC